MSKPVRPDDLATWIADIRRRLDALERSPQVAGSSVSGITVGGGTPSTSAVGDAASDGSSAAAAREDHKHAREAFGAVTPAGSGVSSNGSALTVSHSDHDHGSMVNPMIDAGDMIVGSGSDLFLNASTSAHGWQPQTLSPNDTTLGSDLGDNGAGLGFPSSLAVDGNDTTYWKAGNNSFVHHAINVDLGTAQSVASFRVHQMSGSQQIENWRIQGSSDQVHWTDLYQAVSDPTLDKSVTLGSAATYRYFRLYTDDYGFQGPYLYTFSGFSTGSGAPNRLPAGTPGQFLEVSSGGKPAWTTVTIPTLDGTSSDISASAPGDTKSAGSVGQAADAGHRHSREAFGSVTAQTSFGASSGNGSASTLSHSDHTHGTPADPRGLPVGGGLTGATAATRYVGGTTTGHPSSGTFAVGDYVIAQDGNAWVCTAAGTPGTWTQISGGGGSSTLAGDTDVNISGPSDGQVLTYVASASKWENQNAASGFSDPTTTKGDLIVHGSSTTRLPVGSDTQALVADSSQSLGVKWTGDTSWTAPTLLNSWVNNGGAADSIAGFRKDALGFVHLRGMLKSGTTTPGTEIFLLPTGYRPALTPRFSIVSNAASPQVANVLVDGNDGQVQVGFNVNNTNICLDGITFLAEQ